MQPDVWQKFCRRNNFADTGSLAASACSLQQNAGSAGIHLWDKRSARRIPPTNKPADALHVPVAVGSKTFRLPEGFLEGGASERLEVSIMTAWRFSYDKCLVYALLICVWVNCGLISCMGAVWRG